MELSVFKNSGPGEFTVQFHHWDGNAHITFSKKCSLSFLAQVMPASSSFPAFLLDLSFIFFPAHCISSWNVILICSCVCLLSVSHENRSLVCPVYLYIPTAQGSAWNTVGGKKLFIEWRSDCIQVHWKSTQSHHPPINVQIERIRENRI